MRKKFTFIFPVTKCFPDMNRREGLRYDHVDDLEVSGTATKLESAGNPGSYSYKYKIDAMIYLQTGIPAELNQSLDLENIQAACQNHVENIFEISPISAPPIPVRKMRNLSAKVIPLSLKRKVK